MNAIEPVILEAVRTPFGRRGGIHGATRPDSLLAGALQALVKRAGLPIDAVDDVIAGCVSQAGEQGANIARLATLLAGFPLTVPAVTLNRMCGSGQQALHFAAQAVAAGDATYVIGGGVESMSRVPMFVDVTLGAVFKDWAALNPALAKFDLVSQGESAERMVDRFGLSRAALDRYSAASHAKATAAARAGKHREIVPLDSGVTADEGIRSNIDPGKMATLAPVFRPEDGRITAGNSSQMADGAAAVLIGARHAAVVDGFQPKARFLARVAVGSDPSLQLDGVIAATEQALKRARLSLDDIDWIEINEAFACVPLAWCQYFKRDTESVNPWGGAIAHGHPLGATGAGLVAKALAGLRETGGTFGLVVFCVGHGMSTTTVLERLH